jgi:hypothetical protein
MKDKIMRELKTNLSNLTYDPDKQLATFVGSFRMSSEEFTTVNDILEDALNAQPTTFTMDLTQLDFLNSSGINLLSKFAIAIREQGTTQLVLHASNEITWQNKSLYNLKKLLPTLTIVYEISEN